MALFSRSWLPVLFGVCTLVLVAYSMLYYYCPPEDATQTPSPNTHWPRSTPFGMTHPPTPCSCPKGSILLKDHLPKDQFEEVTQRRALEYKKHQARTNSSLSILLLAPSNSPLQYPIQGFTVRPLTPTTIPGLALHAGRKHSYKVFLKVSHGVLSTQDAAEGVKVEGNGESGLVMESMSLVDLNNLLDKVTYTSTIYHIHTGDLAHFLFEGHEAVFPIVIQQPSPPLLYDLGKNISSQVTITTKTFLRYDELKMLVSSIRRFYSDIEIIIADDSFVVEKISGEHIKHYTMPPAQGWFAGRNLAVSQVTTKYLLWVDDDFLFTEETKIEKLVEVMEAVPELDVVGASVTGNQFFFSLLYEEGVDGGCLDRKSKGKFNPLPNFPQCSLASGVVNFFLARTDAVRRVGFDPKLQRVAHSEFFMDGLGSLLVATCSHVSIGHQPKASSRKDKDHNRYNAFRQPAAKDQELKLQLHFFKNHLKCIRYA